MKTINPTRKFSKHLRFALHQAKYLAGNFGAENVEPAHIVLGFYRTAGALAAELLEHTKLNAELLEAELRGQAEKKEGGELPLSALTEQQLVAATSLAYRARYSYIGTEHVLRAIIDTPGPTLEAFFRRHSWPLESVRDQLDMIFKSGAKLHELTETFEDEEEDDRPPLTDDLPPSTRSFGVHLTDSERAAALDPVVGRAKEIERLMQILMRRTKNNPVLLGDPGVGKTAIVEGLAKRLSQNDVPTSLRHKKIVALDIGSMVAGTMFRGEFENRIKQLLDELRGNDEVILFIDELHTIVGAGSASGSVDAANLLKPALARGELRCIGATTIEEYRRSIESDGALERRFQPIYVTEPSGVETRAILEGLKKNYESYHGLTITSDALDAAVRLSERYLTDRFLPDKAIDLVDEAAARVKVHTTPPESVVRLQELEESERVARRRKEAAVAKEQFEEALHWKRENERLSERKAHLEDELKRHPPRYPVVDASTITNVLTAWTNVPVTDLVQEERDQLRSLETKLKETTVGQEGAVKLVADTVRRARLGLSDRHRPLASFLFAGPSGVGKTTVAKALARALFGDAEALLTIDMSEFSEGFTVSKLIGAPAGYVGYKESGLLTERVRRRPYQVILFDEVDRAHRDVAQLLQQILAEGSLRDATGRLVNFKQTIVIATMNPMKLGGGSLGFAGHNESPASLLSADISRAVRDTLPNELVQRFDALIPFTHLTKENLFHLLTHELARINARLSERNFSVTISEAEAESLVLENLAQNLGARGLIQQIRDLVETNAATMLLATPELRAKTYTLKRTKGAWALKPTRP